MTSSTPVDDRIGTAPHDCPGGDGTPSAATPPMLRPWSLRLGLEELKARLRSAFAQGNVAQTLLKEIDAAAAARLLRAPVGHFVPPPALVDTFAYKQAAATAAVAKKDRQMTLSTHFDSPIGAAPHEENARGPNAGLRAALAGDWRAALRPLAAAMMHAYASALEATASVFDELSILWEDGAAAAKRLKEGSQATPPRAGRRPLAAGAGRAMALTTAKSTALVNGAVHAARRLKAGCDRVIETFDRPIEINLKWRFFDELPEGIARDQEFDKRLARCSRWSEREQALSLKDIGYALRTLSSPQERGARWDRLFDHIDNWTSPHQIRVLKSLAFAAGATDDPHRLLAVYERAQRFYGEARAEAMAIVAWNLNCLSKQDADDVFHEMFDWMTPQAPSVRLRLLSSFPRSFILDDDEKWKLFRKALRQAKSSHEEGSKYWRMLGPLARSYF